MKQKLLIALLLVVSVYAGAQSLDREVRKLAVNITRAYIDGHEDMLIKPRIGVADFKEETKDAVKNSVGTLAAVLLTDEFSRSAVFSVIERKSLDELMKEYKLNLSGLTDETTSPEIGKLQGVELLLVGSVSGVGDKYLITARLVEVETGLVAGSSRIEVPRGQIEQEAERYIASTFQSPYGIILAPSSTALFELNGSGNSLIMNSVDAGYRVSKWLAFTLGYTNLTSSELNGMDTDRIIVPDGQGGTHDTTRYFSFKGDGIKLAASANISPTVRLSLGGQAAAVIYFNPVLEQDFPDFPVWQPNSPTTSVIMPNRIIINGFTHELYASYHLSLSANYLISNRLSFFGRFGAYLFPLFAPTSFYSSTSVRDSTITSETTIDENGTFPQYQSFNFARNSSDERITFSSMGVSVQFGLAVNF